jgi:hypothetical protein
MVVGYFSSSTPPRITVEKGGGGGSRYISESTQEQIIARFELFSNSKSKPDLKPKLFGFHRT